MIRRAIRANPAVHGFAVRSARSGRRAAARIHLREVWTHLRAVTRPPGRGSQKQFVLYGQGRSGSSLLMDLLHSHPDLYCDGEVFSGRAHGRLLSPRHYLDALAALSPRPVYGCQIKIYQMTEQPRIPDPGAFLADLHERGWRIVHLYRRDLFRKSLSLVVTRYRNGLFIVRGKQAGSVADSLRRVQVDPREVVEVMRARQKSDEMEREALGSIPHIAITYEEDLLHAERHGATASRIFDFLGLLECPVSTEVIRTSRDRLSDYILNAEDLVNVVRESGFEASLNA